MLLKPPAITPTDLWQSVKIVKFVVWNTLLLSKIMKKLFIAVFVLSATAMVARLSAHAADVDDPVVRILAIGNSFSEDAVDQYFHEICEAAGKKVIIGDLYIPGCPLERHYLNARTDSAAYRSRRIGFDGVTITAEPVRLSSALRTDEWDFISFQQSSPLSGLYSSYGDLKPLMAYVDSLSDGSPRYMWHQTWAYSPGSTHGAFPTYGSDQKVMYDSIMGASRQVIADHPALDFVIPAGTAIQTARTVSGNLDLTRDGYHLDYVTGRYIAACTWFEAIFGESVVGNPYHPEGMSSQEARMAQEAAHSAVSSPFAVISATDR